MKMKNMNKTQRLLFFNISIISTIAIGLTGFDQIHWFAWFVPAALLFAALSGYCVGLEVSAYILKLMRVTS
jgi:hypothetical protein